MVTLNASSVRKDWSAVLDIVAREKPVFFKRTRDEMFLSDISFLHELLSLYRFNAQLFNEDDGSVTASLDEIDLIENAATKEEAINLLAKSILEYAKEYYDDFGYWSRGSRKSHKPYVLKALLLDNAEAIGGLITCRLGET